MIVLKNIPGLGAPDLIRLLKDNMGAEIRSGYGGVVVDERTAFEFLRIYLSETTNPSPQPETDPLAPTPKRRGRPPKNQGRRAEA